MKHNIKTIILKVISVAAVIILIFISLPMLQSAISIQKFVDEAKSENVVWLCEREYVDVSDETHINYHEWQPVRYYGLTQGTELNMIVYGAALIPGLILSLAAMQVTYEVIGLIRFVKKTLKKKEERA